MTSRGNLLIENAAGNKNDHNANKHHGVIVPSVGRWLLDAVDHQEFHRSAL